MSEKWVVGDFENGVIRRIYECGRDRVIKRTEGIT
jgi:hypothetical protein